MRERAILDLFAAMEKPLGSMVECKHYPCHFKGQDCSFCYCPFYPCFMYILGGHFVVTKGKITWSCRNCNWIHRKDVVEEIAFYFSNYPRQRLVEEGWFFYSKALQEILFGREVGEWIGKCYSLVKANMRNARKSETCLALLVELRGFEILDVKEINRIEGEGIVVPLKIEKKLYGIAENCLEYDINHFQKTK
ncbi:MAG: hypothetical protein NZ895_04710 [Archaeoglobaceae archaeon]|nr:hypothetical protein [Archaeoglobaceae archaeon]MCX8152639.1 hypothetical protein [Archaeoglobaceae archaeon]MDW8014079.1 cysteine-rich small domain-containing protein [Archaeoglobaceae archaeon]